MPKENVRYVAHNGAKGGWTVRKPSSFRASAHRRTQEDAVERAKEIVSNLGGGRVVVTDLDESRWESVQQPDGSWRDSGAAPLEADIAIPPGELLAEELEARGMTQRDLAALMGRSPATVSKIIAARAAITPRTAIELERALRIPASIWVGLEGRYRLALARQDMA